MDKIMNIRNFMKIVERVLIDAPSMISENTEVTQDIVREIRNVRHEIRAVQGGDGQCHEVSEWIEGEYGWKRVDGAYTAPNGDAITSPHYWNMLPDGSIFDATTDQFGEGYDMRIIHPNDPDFARYRPEWYADYHPDHSEYDQNHSRLGWAGEMDYDAINRLRAERGDGWWITDKDQSEKYEKEQDEYRKNHKW